LTKLLRQCGNYLGLLWAMSIAKGGVFNELYTRIALGQRSSDERKNFFCPETIVGQLQIAWITALRGEVTFQILFYGYSFSFKSG
jgi:hypothetical protein